MFGRQKLNNPPQVLDLRAPQPQSPARRLPRLLLVIITLVILLAAGVLAWRFSLPHDQKLPANITSQTHNFTPYFYAKNPPAGLKLDTDNVTYNQGILLFRLTNKAGQSVSISEQALPEDLKNSRPQSKDTIDGVPGFAALAHTDGRSAITFIAKNPDALIVINTKDSVDTDALKDLTRQLRPIR